MRLTTVIFFGLLAWFTLGLTAVGMANSDPKPFTQTGESNSFTRPTHKSFTSTPIGEIDPKVFEELDINDLMVPVDPNESAPNSNPSKPDLFSQPFYPGSQDIAAQESATPGKTLSSGAEGSKVASLQRRLKTHGFNPGPIDSVFGSRTKTAVQDFQESRGLVADGVVDDTTWKALAAAPELQPQLSLGSAPMRQPQPQLPLESAPMVQPQLQFPSESAPMVQPQPPSPLESPPLVAANPLLNKGATGSKVRTLQVRLENQGFDPGPVDGIFGPRTAAAVSAFQESQGLNGTGVVDDQTWMALSQTTSPQRQ